MGSGFQQKCAFSPLRFMIYMNWTTKLNQTDEYVTIIRCKINQLLFADDLVLLASSKSGLQHALNGFAATCDIAGMKISTSTTEVLQV